MSQKISKLEGRIAVLSQLKDDEQIMDSMMVTVGCAVTTSSELDSTSPWLEAAPTTAAAPGADHWAKLGDKLGAKPKALVSCTPSQSDPWILAKG